MKIIMKITHIAPTESWTGKDGAKQFKMGVVFEDPNVRYPNIIYATIFGSDAIRRFDFAEGDLVDVEFFHQAREYNGRWYNEIRVRDFTPASIAEEKDSARPFGY